MLHHFWSYWLHADLFLFLHRTFLIPFQVNWVQRLVIQTLAWVLHGTFSNPRIPHKKRYPASSYHQIYSMHTNHHYYDKNSNWSSNSYMFNERWLRCFRTLGIVLKLSDMLTRRANERPRILMVFPTWFFNSTSSSLNYNFF